LQLQTLIRSFSPMVSLWNLQFFDPMPCRSAKLLSMLALLYLLPFERVEAILAPKGFMAIRCCSVR